MPIEYMRIIGITVIANAIGIILGYGIRKVGEKISEKPLRKFWNQFLRNGGNIVIPPYPKNRSDFSVKGGTGYSDCIASGEIRKFLALKRLSNNSKTEEKERQIELQIQKEAKFLVLKAIVRQPHSR